MHTPYVTKPSQPPALYLPVYANQATLIEHDLMGDIVLHVRIASLGNPDTVLLVYSVVSSESALYSLTTFSSVQRKKCRARMHCIHDGLSYHDNSCQLTTARCPKCTK